MKQIEQSISSIEVAEMVGKDHNKLLRDIREYISQLGQSKIGHTSFFTEAEYTDKSNRQKPCYKITKKGCEFIAHKLTGVKGTEFTAKYINRFHDMEDTIRQGISQKDNLKTEHLASVNNAVKILTPMLKAAGCDSKIQLLTAKTLYEKAGVELPVMIEADQQYYDTVHIARQVGLYYQSSGKPADKAVNEIIRRLNISEDLYTETWESKGKWQGTVRKYAPQVISMIRQWYADNGYPRDIEYVQCDGQKKCYHVIWRDTEVA
ncbi:MAG: Rha family transcriptional regulator [Dorea sp.]|nr:Rha family transcriptional regulator [Dorea sp.]